MSLATLVVVGVVSHRTITDFVSSTIWMSQTHLVIETLLELQATIDAAESRQRGYLLTGDPYFRKPTVAEVASKAERLIAKARDLIGDQNQQRRLDQLRPLVAARLAIVHRILAVRDADGLPAAIEYIVVHRPWELTATVKRRIGEAIAVEHGLLEERDRFARAAAHSALNVVTYGTPTAFAFVLFAGVFIQRALRGLRAAGALASERTHELEESQVALQTQIEAATRARIWFRQMLDAAPDAIVVVDQAGRIMLFNAIAEEMFGYAAAEVLGHPIERLLPDHLETAHQQHRASFFAAPRARLMGEGLDLFARRKDGSEFPVDVRLSPFEGETGNWVVSTIRDLTERKRAQETQALIASLVETSRYAIVTHAIDGAVTTWNQGAEQTYGYSAAEVIGRKVGDLVVPEERANVTAHFDRMRRGEGMQEFETRMVRKDGALIEVSIAMSPIQDARGNITAYSTLSTDISQRKHAERALAERTTEITRSNAELEQFAYVASHDLQEPLRMVASYVELLARRYKGRLDQDADEFIGFAVDGAVRMKRLINDLLNYSRAGRGQPLGPVQLGGAVNRALANLAFSIEEAGAIVTCDALPTVRGDESQLVELVQNLVANAVKFRGPRPPRIHISSTRKGAQWLISVRDNGIGINSEYADRIFVMFQRLHGAAEYPGTGIGLAICKRIVERHGGVIWMESQPGHGSTFQFTLNAAAQDEDHANAASR
jgi:PAS domain S-box-containing protein